MMKKNAKENGKKVRFIVKASAITLLLLSLMGLVTLFLLDYYLGKIDYHQSVTTVAVETEPTDTIQPSEIPEGEQENTVSSQPDSTAEEIATLERRLTEQTSGVENILFDEDVMNILLIGYDSRGSDSRGRSDTNILVSINRETKEITTTSIMRDCYVAIPGYGNNRLNAAYAYGGGDLLSETVEKNFQIRVNNYAAVNFYAFMDIIDMLGGVEIEISDAEAEVMNGYITELNGMEGCEEKMDWLDGGGTLHLNGKQTLAYTRVRYVGNADFERTERQRTVLEKVFEKAKQMNLLELNDLLNCLLPEVSTDMSEKEVLFLLLKGPAYLQYDLKSLRIPADGTYESLRINGMEVLGVDLEANRKLLEQEVYGSGQE